MTNHEKPEAPKDVESALSKWAEGVRSNGGLRITTTPDGDSVLEWLPSNGTDDETAQLIESLRAEVQRLTEENKVFLAFAEKILSDEQLATLKTGAAECGALAVALERGGR